MMKRDVDALELIEILDYVSNLAQIGYASLKCTRSGDRFYHVADNTWWSMVNERFQPSSPPKGWGRVEEKKP